MGYIFIILIIIIFYIIKDFIVKNIKPRKNSPPGPINLPILGCLHRLGSNPHRGMRNNISDIYGPISSCYLGDNYSIIVSNSTLVNEIYIKNFKSFCSRPHNFTFNMFSGGYNDLAFADNYESWKKVRSLVGGCFTKTKLNESINTYIEQQTKLLIKCMKEFEKNNLPFYPQKHYMKLSLNVICKLLFSLEILPNETIDKTQMERISIPIQKISKKLGAGHLDDFVAITSPLFYFSKKKYNGYVKSCTNFISEIYDNHLVNLDKDNSKDLMDLLINDSNGENKDAVVHTAFDFLLGGSDSSSGTMEFFSLYMINYPEVQEKVFNEINQEMGNCSFISYKDKNSLPYLNACINEVLRLNPEDPLGIPRMAVEDIEINGYFIPKGAHIHHNLYAIGTNPLLFEDRDRFLPERWINCDENQRNILLANCIPFSVGPRSCIGKNLSEIEIFVACANLILNYKMSSYDGLKKFDEIEEFGITTHPKQFSIKLTPRK